MQGTVATRCLLILFNSSAVNLSVGLATYAFNSQPQRRMLHSARYSKYPIEQSRRNLTSCLVDVNREARIRALCAKASATTEISEVDAALAELRAELHKHIEELRTQARKDVPFLIRTTKPQPKPQRESLRSKDFQIG